MHLRWLKEEVVQIDRVVDIGHEFLLFNQFIIDAQTYDHARKGKSGPLEWLNLRREVNLNVTVMTYDLRIEEFPRDVCKKIKVPEKTIGQVVEIRLVVGVPRQCLSARRVTGTCAVVCCTHRRGSVIRRVDLAFVEPCRRYIDRDPLRVCRKPELRQILTS